MTKTEVGSYRERITIQQDNSNAGDPDPDYTGAAFAKSVPARVISTHGEETFRGRQLDPSVKYVVEMHHKSGVTASMRLQIDTGVYSGNLLNIGWVKTVPYSRGRPPQTWLYCTELIDV